jgi:D-3-phosphoglycerate dehydrogenase / 2-oxoglutarate reductase
VKRVFVTHPQHRLAHYFGAQAMARLESLAQVQYNPNAHDLNNQELAKFATNCDVVIAYRQTPLDSALLAALPSVKAVLRCAVDIRTIDVDAASANGILVTRASPGFQAAVSEWIMGVMVDLSRGISAAQLAYKAGAQATPTMGRELRGSTVGIVGVGEIGRHLAPILLAFGAKVLAYDPFTTVAAFGVKQCEFEELLAASDYVICLAPANAETENMFNATRFAQMQRGAYFINAARGNLIDEAALLDALTSEHLAGAALDVGRAADQMPSEQLTRHPKVIATPHIGGLTPNAIEHQALECVEQCAQVLQGHIPLGAVNPAFAKRLVALRS